MSTYRRMANNCVLLLNIANHNSDAFPYPPTLIQLHFNIVVLCRESITLRDFV